MWNYQKESGRIGIDPTAHERETDRHRRREAFDPPRVKDNAVGSAVQPWRIAQGTLNRSAGKRPDMRATFSTGHLLWLQRIRGNRHIAGMFQRKNLEDGQCGMFAAQNKEKVVGATNDRREQNVDHSFNSDANWERQAYARQNAGSALQRKEAEEDEESVQAKLAFVHLQRKKDALEMPLKAGRSDLTYSPQPTENGVLCMGQPKSDLNHISNLHIMRRATVVPAPFLGGSPFNDSAVTFTPRGEMYVGGAVTSSSNFSGGGAGTVQIAAGESGVAQIHMDVHGFEDNMLINQSWDQSFYVSWNVSAARDGTLTINGNPTPNVGSRSSSGDSFGALSAVNPSNGTNYVQVSPKIVSGGSSGGVSLGVGVTSNFPGSFIQNSFRLNIVVTGVVTPSSTTHTTQVTFGVGSDEVPAASEAFIVTWYSGLPAELRSSIESGATQIVLRGYASTTQPGPANRDLARRRAQHTRSILQDTAGTNARFNIYAHGEYRARTPDETEDPLERRVEISATYTPETSP